MPGNQTKEADKKEAPPEKGSAQAPAIQLPKGGGAIRGIGEKFAANPVTGTGSMTVPIATSPGRSSFGPQLSLSYDSGAGNGPFGLGWSLSLPSITRKTDKGLPKYQDAEESDVYILSGAEDLVPVCRQDPDGTWVAGHSGYQRDPAGFWVRDPSGRLVVHEDELDGYRVRRYRPRIEGLFARIDRWSRIASPSEVHWRSISKDNILTLYGFDANSRIADPLDASRVFSWLICETRDDKGNAVLYRYKAEDGLGVDLGNAHERNRGPQDDARRTANRYLKRIHYGNRTPLLDNAGHRPRFLDKPQIDIQIGNAGWMFEMVFDYDDHDAAVPKPNDDQAKDATGALKYPWKPRPDPFSVYRSGFEVRTTRLCQRVLMFHHFPGEAGVERDCLVRSTDFNYSDEVDPTDVRNPVYTFLQAVTQTGYRRNNGGYEKRSLPPVEFKYTEPVVQDAVEDVDQESLENLPAGLDGSAYRWTDLHGEGIPGILTEQAGAWFYKRNLSPIPEKLADGRDQVKAQFAPLETVALKPNIVLSGGAEFMDLAGDGQPDLVVMDGPMPGLYEHDEDEGWQSFNPFTSRLNRDMRDPNLKFVDLDGDGHADVLITEDDAFVWHASLAEEGFGPARRVAQALDEEKGPRIVFADGTQSIYLADLSGDGLTDIVRIRNGEVCYWPNLSYGSFGAKVTMDNAPTFDNPDQFDHKRIRLADIDGSGTTDIIYLHRDGVRLYFNQSGNSWSKPYLLNVFPRVDDVVSIVPTDLLGNGTACLVWSSPLLGDARRQMRYVNLMGNRKPHLLVKTINNLGAETRVDYAPSTKFYLEDKRDGKPWITRLPFPVHVVERVATYDYISRNRFVTRYAYHHGYFDGEEREFRGFGMVEQWDTEEFAALSASDSLAPLAGEGRGEGVSNIEAASHVPPVLTKTWFHTGVYLGCDHVSDFFAGLLNAQDKGEYYREPGLTDQEAANLGLDDEARRLYDDARAKERLLDDTVLPRDLTLEEEREACRALKGSMLRQEVYALDGTPKAEHPYTVTEQNFTVKHLQPRDGNRHAVFFTHTREAINYHYERNPADPRVSHALTLDVDKYGNVLKQVAIGYGRRPGLSPLQGEDKKKQEQLLITYTENVVTNAIDAAVIDPSYDPDNYRTPLPSEARTYELTGLTPESGAQRFSFNELTKDNFKIIRELTDVPYQQLVDYAVKRKRLIEHVRTLYRKNDLTSLLPLKKLQSMALPGESYKLSFTPGLLGEVYKRKKPDNTIEDLLTNPTTMLAGEGGYKNSQDLRNQGVFPANNTQPLWTESDADNHWWIPSGKQTFDPAHFYLPIEFVDPFGNKTTITYEAPFYLLLKKTEDPLHNTVETKNDYRVLQPKLVTDPNGNRAEVAFDALGLVAGTAVMGKENEPDGKQKGDLLDGFEPDLTQAQVDAFLATPREPGVDPSESVATQIVHDLLGQASTRIVYDLGRFKRLGKPPFAATIAREKHVSDLAAGERSKLQVSFSYSDGFGREIQKKIQAEPGRLDEGSPVVSPRWVGSGWTIFNNKGKPVRQYEPFFDSTHDFKFGRQVGVSPILFYDPVERVVATLHPNHTYEKVVFDPWRQQTYDVNDTINVPRNPGDPPFDPKNDSDVGHYFRRLPDDEYLPTWYDLRTDAAKALQAWPDSDAQGRPLPDNAKRRAAELRAAAKAAAHADTPTTAHFDTLGRPFLTLADNGPDPAQPGQHLLFATRVELDIEGNQRAVRDAIVQAGDKQGRVVMRYDYDLLGNRIHQASMEAGERWMLNDATGKPIRAWNDRRYDTRVEYDPLRLPIRSFVKGGDGTPKSELFAQEVLFARTVYGEQHPDGLALNLRTRPFLQFDSAGVVTHQGVNPTTGQDESYDFKGNLLRSSRALAGLDPTTGQPAYRATVDWTTVDQVIPRAATTALDIAQLTAALGPVVDASVFHTSTTFDALNRPLTVTSPDRSVYRPTFNEANLLDKVEVELRGAGVATAFVTNIDYNEKGQRKKIEYKNGATTTYTYDDLTFRLSRLKTTRPANADATASQLFKDPSVVQDLRYAYDPVGNITRIEDVALKTIIRNGQNVEPVGAYTYDAIYRLIEAVGREHIGQNAFDFNPPNGDCRDYPFAGHRAHPNDLQALRNYTERYEYDPVGNFVELAHRFNGAGWTRHYEYLENSLIEAGKKGNRLTRTTVGNGLNHIEPYTHDTHGNMTSMPHLAAMVWEFKDQLQQADLGGGGTAYYVYDGAGQRVRKVIESQNGARQKERLYLGGFEIYREYNGNGNVRTLERESLYVLDDKQRIALVETQTIQNGNPVNGPVPLQRYQLGNHLGSSSVELDKDGALIAYEEYHPYGTTSFQAGRSAAEVSLKRYRYTAKERDEESGLYYHGARYYSPWLARWTRPDPALWRLYREEPGTRRNVRLLLNPFAAMAGNPVAFVDLDGEQDTAYTRYLDRQFATVEGAQKVQENNRALADAVLDWGRNIVKGTQHQWKEGSTADRVEVAATGVGAASGAVPYAGDYVSLGSSVVAFGAKPSWSNAGGVVLDVIGAVLPFVPALGTVKRADKFADAAKEAEKLANAAKEAEKIGDAAKGMEKVAEAAPKPKVPEAPKPGERVPAPKELEAFPDLERARPKTPVQGGGGLRKRWTDKKGNIYEWDSQHGTIEKYDKRGKHMGEFHPKTGEQLKPPDKTRKVKR